MPVGSGQWGGRVRHDANAADNVRPTIQAAIRQGRRSRIRWVNKRQPQNAGGRIIAMVATPKSCIARSAAIAPVAPKRLRTGELVAWLKLGSLTDQVASAAATM